MPTYYSLKVNKTGVALRVEVNGVPVINWPNAEQVERTDMLNGWLEAGSVPVHVAIEWPDDAGDFKPGVGHVELRVEPMTRDGQIGKPLLEFKWPPQEPDAERYPHEETLQLQVDDPPPAELWKQARVVLLDDRQREEILEVAKRLHRSLDERKADAAVTLLEWKGRDLRRALYNDPSETKTDLRDFLDFFLDEPGWEIEPLVEDELEIHALSKNRLVMVTGADFADPIRTKEDKEPGIRIPLYLANIDGKWIIVR